MKFLYTFAIVLYGFVLRCLAIFHPKARQFVGGRKNVFDELNKHYAERQPQNLKIWFHCASVGEFEQGRPVIELLKKQFPNSHLLLTFFSPSGYELRKNYEFADCVAYLPLDLPQNASRFLEITKPDAVFFVKYEFWYYYLSTLKANNIPTFLISAHFRPNQVFFKPYGKFFKEILNNFNHIFTQNESSHQLLNKCGISHTSIAGDTRADRVWRIKQENKRFELVDIFVGNSKVLVVGSSWNEDIEAIAPALNQVVGLKAIIAPHEISETNLQFIETQFADKQVLRYSKANLQNLQNVDVLLIDSVGMLAALYAYGTIAFVGGGFAQGLHNVLEPAVFGLPVLFGDQKYKQFQEANDLIAIGGALAVNSAADCSEKMVFALENAEKIGQIAAQYVKNNIGAADKIMVEVSAILRTNQIPLH